MKTQIKIDGKCPRCSSKNLYYGEIIGQGCVRGSIYLLCENCGEDLGWEVINHRRIRVKEELV